MIPVNVVSPRLLKQIFAICNSFSPCWKDYQFKLACTHMHLKSVTWFSGDQTTNSFARSNQNFLLTERLVPNPLYSPLPSHKFIMKTSTLESFRSFSRRSFFWGTKIFFCTGSGDLFEKKKTQIMDSNDTPTQYNTASNFYPFKLTQLPLFT